MIPPAKERSFVLALHPVSHGMGWIVFSGPFSPHDWGVIRPRTADKNAECVSAAEGLLMRFEPETLVLEAFDKSGTRRRTRIANLGRALVAVASNHGTPVAVYRRGDVQSVFAVVGAHSRQQIAEAVARSFDMLRHKLPPTRRVWQSESVNVALFAAAALVVTHYQRDAETLLDELHGSPEIN